LKKKVFQLEQGEGTIVGQQNLKVFITEYYKKLFAAPETNFCKMREKKSLVIFLSYLKRKIAFSQPFL
jgi:hypothetical protein